jgi:hypothetical protein
VQRRPSAAHATERLTTGLAKPADHRTTTAREHRLEPDLRLFASSFGNRFDGNLAARRSCLGALLICPMPAWESATPFDRS